MSPTSAVGIRCYFCGRPITAVTEGSMIIYSQDVPPYVAERITHTRPDGGTERVGALAYPGMFKPGANLATFAHNDCAPDGDVEGDPGYAIQLSRLSEDWEEQLGEKTWCFPQIFQVLDLARATFRVRRVPNT